MTNITIPIPKWLDLLFALPVLLFRFFKLGYTYRKIPLGEGRFALVDPDAYYRLNKFQWSISANNGLIYAVRYALTKSGKTAIIEMHREIFNAPKDRLVDHQNNSTLDNRTNNLRLATRSQNACNRRKKNNTSSRFRGVFLEKRSGHWGARIYLNGKQIWLGYFDSELDAARAYDRAAVKYHGEFAKLNFPKELERSPRRISLRLANWLGARLNFSKRSEDPREDVSMISQQGTRLNFIEDAASPARPACPRVSLSGERSRIPITIIK